MQGTLSFDDVLMHLGEFGSYQKMVYLLLCLPIPIVACHILVSVFTLVVPDFLCTANVTNLSLTHFVTYQDDQSKCYFESFNGTLEDCHAWTFDQTYFTTTAVTKFNWVCKDKTLHTYASMIYMVGMLLGAAIFGPLADIFGRKLTFYLGNILHTIFSMATIFAPEFYSFCFFRILDGICGVPVFLSAFSIGLELVGPRKRQHAGIVIEYFFATGLVILAGLAYCIRDWRYLQLSTALPGLLFLPYWWIIPESPRWLLLHDRHDEAREIVLRLAQCNKITLPQNLLAKMDEKRECKSAYLWQLFKTWKIALWSVTMILNWMVVCMCYYGLSLNTNNLHGNVHLNFFLSGLVEFPGYAICQLLLNRIGRKKLFIISMMFGGTSCVATVLPVVYLDSSLQWVTVMLSLFGKLGASCAFATIYIFCGEMFPTILRAQATAMCIVAARTGTIISSYITAACAAKSEEMGKVLPLVIFGLAAIIVGLFTLTLPETMNRRLPETLQEFTRFPESCNIYAHPSAVFEGGCPGAKHSKDVSNGEVYDTDCLMDDSAKIAFEP